MYRLVLLGCIFLSVSGCAVRGVLSGGEDDTQAPKLHEKNYSTPNGITNFKYDELILSFDEWVQLNDPANQIVVSPLLDEKPDVKLKGSSLVLRFKGPLKPDITYTVNFGDAVKDITKGNIAQDLVRVFSTGPKLDSGFVDGLVLDALTLEPVENAIVMLHSGLNDSVVVNSRPLYISKTTKAGRFQLPNIKSGTYKVFVLKDINSNYKFDLPNEPIAFMNQNLVVRDSLKTSLNFKLFEQAQQQARLSENTAIFGKVVLSYAASLPEKNIEVKGDNLEDWLLGFEQNDKELTVWYRDSLPKVQFEVQMPGFRDTVKLAKFPSRSSLKDKLLPVVETAAAGAATAPGKMSKNTKEKAPKALLSELPLQDSTKALVLQFNLPIDSLLMERCVLLQDSQAISFKSSIKNNRELLISADWKGGSSYTLSLNPGALQDVYGKSHDTLVYKFKAAGKADYGNIAVKPAGLDTGIVYIMELLDKDKKFISRKSVLTTDTLVSFNRQILGSYYIKLIRDDNANGRWDPGNYFDARQPEAIVLSDALQIQKGFDAELSLDIKAGKGAKANIGKGGAAPTPGRTGTKPK